MSASIVKATSPASTAMTCCSTCIAGSGQAIFVERDRPEGDARCPRSTAVPPPVLQPAWTASRSASNTSVAVTPCGHAGATSPLITSPVDDPRGALERPVRLGDLPILQGERRRRPGQGQRVAVERDVPRRRGTRRATRPGPSAAPGSPSRSSNIGPTEHAVHDLVRRRSSGCSRRTPRVGPPSKRMRDLRARHEVVAGDGRGDERAARRAPGGRRPAGWRRRASGDRAPRHARQAAQRDGEGEGESGASACGSPCGAMALRVVAVRRPSAGLPDARVPGRPRCEVARRPAARSASVRVDGPSGQLTGTPVHPDHPVIARLHAAARSTPTTRNRRRAGPNQYVAPASVCPAVGATPGSVPTRRSPERNHSSHAHPRHHECRGASRQLDAPDAPSGRQLRTVSTAPPTAARPSSSSTSSAASPTARSAATPAGSTERPPTTSGSAAGATASRPSHPGRPSQGRPYDSRCLVRPPRDTAPGARRSTPHHRRRTPRRPARAGKETDDDQRQDPRPGPARAADGGRDGGLRARQPALAGAVRAGQGLAPRRRPDELDGQVGRALPAVRRMRRRAPTSRTSTATSTWTSASATPARWPGTARRPRIRAVERQMRRGITHMLPTEDAIVAGDELRRRFGLRYWQFTLTATDANRFVIRLARHITGRVQGRRPQPLLPRLGGRDVRGHRTRRRGGRAARQHRQAGAPSPRPRASWRSTTSTGLERELAKGDVAACLFEPALTNVGHRPARARLPRGRPRADPALRDAAHQRRDAHDLRGPGRLHGRPRPGAGLPHDRQDDRRRDPGGGLRVHRGGRRADPREHRARGLATSAASAGPWPATRSRWPRSGRP